MTFDYERKATSLKQSLPGLSTRAANAIVYWAGVETPEEFMTHFTDPKQILYLKGVGPITGANIAWALWKAGFLGPVKKEGETPHE